jgi:tetratricopeptide (TPR) repeat protein
MSKKGLIFLLLIICSCANRGVQLKTAETSGHENVEEAEPLPSKYDAYYHFSLSMLHKERKDILSALRELELAEGYDPNSALIKYNLAMMYLSLNRLDKSIEKLTEALDLNPNYVPARALLGKIYASSNDPKKKREGIRELEKSIKLGSDDIDIYIFLGNVYTENKEYDKAEKILTKVTELAPHDERGYYFLGRLYLEKGELEESVTYYKKALEQNPAYPLALVDIARVYEKLGRPVESEKIYKDLISFYPLSLESYIRYGNFLFTVNRIEDAQVQFKKAEKLDSQNPDVKLRLGLLYLEEKDYDKAIEEFNIVLIGNPDDERVKYYLAHCYTETGRFDEALNLLKDIGSDSSFYDDALVQKAYIYEKRGQLEDALKIMQETTERLPDNEILINYLGGLYRKLNRDNEAIETYKAFLRRNPGNEVITYSLGVAYFTNKDEEKGISTMRKILEKNPNHADALNFIGYSYAEMGKNLDEAEMLVKKANEISPNRGYIIDSLGWVYYKKGQLDKALEYLLEAVRLTSDDPSIMEHLGDVYNDRGDVLKALEYYQKGLELNEDDDHEITERLQKKILVVKEKINAQAGKEKI